jgi:hypothetical protein
MSWLSNIKWPTQAQVNNVLRHGGSVVGTLVTVAGLMALITSSQSADIMSGVQDVIAGLTQAFGGAWKIGIVVGPLMITWMAKMGWNAVSPPAALATVNAIQPTGSVTALVAPNAPQFAQDAAKDAKLPNIIHDPPVRHS